MPSDLGVYTIKEAMPYLRECFNRHFGRSTLSKWCTRGYFPNAQLKGSTWLIPKKDLEEFELPESSKPYLRCIVPRTQISSILETYGELTLRELSLHTRIAIPDLKKLIISMGFTVNRDDIVFRESCNDEPNQITKRL